MAQMTQAVQPFQHQVCAVVAIGGKDKEISHAYDILKDPEKRASLLEIMAHDWVTCNGVQPLPIHFSPSINVIPADTSNAIKMVNLIAIIRIRIRKRILSKLRGSS